MPDRASKDADDVRCSACYLRLTEPDILHVTVKHGTYVKESAYCSECWQSISGLMNLMRTQYKLGYSVGQYDGRIGRMTINPEEAGQ